MLLFRFIVPRLQLLGCEFLLCSFDALLEGVPFLDALLADVDWHKGVQDCARVGDCLGFQTGVCPGCFFDCLVGGHDGHGLGHSVRVFAAV